MTGLDCDPYGDLGGHTVMDVLDAYEVAAPEFRDYLRGYSDADPPSVEDWLTLPVETEGRLALRLTRRQSLRPDYRVYAVARDERGWVAAFRHQSASWARALHVRPNPGTLHSWIDDARPTDAESDAGSIVPVVREDLPMPLHQCFAAAARVDDALHDAKPQQCHGCGQSRYEGAGPDSASETDFRLRRDDSSDDEYAWECGTCRTKTYLKREREAA